MQRMALILAIWIAGITGALAQNQVTVIGPVTPGDCASFNSTTVIKDAGVTCNGGGGAGTPGGVNGSIQFNNTGVFGGYTLAQLTALLIPFASASQGVVPASGGGIVNFLRADATWQPVVVGPASSVTGDLPSFNGTGGNLLQDSGVAAANVPLLSANNVFLGKIGFKGGQPWFDVTAYGAKCDGATHDEVAFQAALNAALAVGGVLALPVGNCVLNATITNGTASSTTTQIVGLGGSASVVTFLGSTGFAFNVTAGIYNLQNFQIACSATSSVACLKIFSATQSTATSSVIRNIYISNSGAYGMYFQNMSQTQLIGCSIVSGAASSVGLYIDDTQTADAGGNLIQGNTFVSIHFPSATGIQMLNVGGLRLLDNIIDGYGTDILHQNTLVSGAATGIQIQRNQIDDFVSTGILFTSAGTGGIIAHVNVSENTMHQASSVASGGGAILIQEAPGSVHWVLNAGITGNTMDTFAGGAGISVAGSTGITITGNAIGDESTTVGPAIVTTASVQNCTITGNAVNQYTTHLSNAAACTAAGNN